MQNLVVKLQLMVAEEIGAKYRCGCRSACVRPFFQIIYSCKYQREMNGCAAGPGKRCDENCASSGDEAP